MILNFIVLGQIPGTQLQISFVGVLSIALAITLGCWLGFKLYVKAATDKSKKTLKAA